MEMFDYGEEDDSESDDGSGSDDLYPGFSSAHDSPVAALMTAALQQMR